MPSPPWAASTSSPASWTGSRLPGLFRKPAFWVLAFAILIRLVTLAQIVHVPYFDSECEAFDQINFHTGALALSHGNWRAPSGNEPYSPPYEGHRANPCG